MTTGLLIPLQHSTAPNTAPMAAPATRERIRGAP